MIELMENCENSVGTAFGEADEKLLERMPTLQEFLKRSNAKARSFRKFVIESEDAPKYGKLRKTVGTITLEKNGTLNLPPDVEPPTDSEIEAIKKEVANAKLPENKPAPRRSLPEKLKQASRETIFEFMSRDGQHLLFVQERRDNPDGAKSYIPWSYWSDDQWRQMEPDGLLPLYGLNRLGSGGAVFLHEGAKAARHVQWMIDQELKDAKDAYAAHPWANELSLGDHLGWIGGALNPHRTDWSPIKSLPRDTPIYIVADNDQVGIKAVRSISRQLQRQVTAIVFDDRFKLGFDLADPWPARQDWWRGNHYAGSTFSDMCRPATWATHKVHATKAGRPSFALRDEFAREWVMSIDPHVFVHRTYANVLLKPEEFNRLVAPFSDVDDVARLLAKEFASQVVSVAYRPHGISESPGQIITVDGKRTINTFTPSSIKPHRDGDPKLFLEFMEYLLPEKGDREHVMRWCATLVVKPEVRMRYSMLLISERQGVGKTTLSNSILAPLVGRRNVSAPSEHQVTESPFNSWIAHKRLITINEIYSGEKRKCYDKLKSVISDDDLEVNPKNIKPYMIENWAHVVACSNSLRALHLDDEDRRWLVPRVTENLQDKEYWREFHSWLKGGGLGVIAGYFARFVAESGAVATEDRAPDTVAKSAVIEASRSEGQQIAYDLACNAVAMGKETENGGGVKVVVVVNKALRDWVAMKRGVSPDYNKLEGLITLRKAMVAGGMTASDKRMKIGDRNSDVVANFQMGAGATWSGLKEHVRTPESIESI